MLLCGRSAVSIPNLPGTPIAFEGISSRTEDWTGGLPVEVSQSSPIPHFQLGNFPQPSGCSVSPRGRVEERRKGPRSTGIGGQEREEIPAMSRNPFHLKRGDKSCRLRNKKH